MKQTIKNFITWSALWLVSAILQATWFTCAGFSPDGKIGWTLSLYAGLASLFFADKAYKWINS